VIRIIGPNLGQQAYSWDALVEDLCGHRYLDQGLALGAGPLAANVAIYCEQADLAAQLLSDVFANMF